MHLKMAFMYLFIFVLFKIVLQFNFIACLIDFGYSTTQTLL